MKDSKNAKIIFENEYVVFVQAFNKNAAAYYGPPKVTELYDRDFSHGDLYFAVSKYNPGPEYIYTLYKPTDGELEYYSGIELKLESYDNITFKYPYLKPYVQDIRGNSEIYDLLLKIKNGQKVNNWDANRFDPIIYDIKFNEQTPGKSRVKLKFDDYEDYWKLFDLSDGDIWFANYVYSNYDSYNFESDEWVNDEWNQGYLLRELNDVNLIKLKEILKILSPELSQLQNDEEWEKASSLLLTTFERESQEIISDWLSERNNCKERGARKMMEDDCCNFFQNYGIFNMGYCFYSYVTTVSVLLSLYSMTGERHLTVSEVLSDIGHKSGNLGGWEEYSYEQDCIDFDDESFNRSCGWQLDNMFTKLEDSDEFEDIKKFSDNASKILSKYDMETNYKLPKDESRKFKIVKMDPKTNKVHVVVSLKGEYRGEERSYDFEDFDQLLHQSELFENKFVKVK